MDQQDVGRTKLAQHTCECVCKRAITEGHIHFGPWPQARARSGCWITLRWYEIFLPSLVYLEDSATVLLEAVAISPEDA